jgi:hypothetical protein
MMISEPSSIAWVVARAAPGAVPPSVLCHQLDVRPAELASAISAALQMDWPAIAEHCRRPTRAAPGRP